MKASAPTDPTSACPMWIQVLITGDLDRQATDAAGHEIPGLLAELEARAIPSAGLIVLYRQEVLGESLADMAAESGLSENALRLRRRRAIERIRKELAA